jgi:hypothetical protein
MMPRRANALVLALLCTVLGFAAEALAGPPRLLPKSLDFWDDSENWTTEYGPAYRDTVEKLENMVPCTGRYALCFHSGPQPLPCELTKDGRFANCKCTAQEGLNFVLITAILNHDVYLDTIATCGVDGSRCAHQPDLAPVCTAIQQGKLLPGADLISTYDPDTQAAIKDILEGGGPDVTVCPKGPYAGCMTAGCTTNKAGDVTCACPVFWGKFQLLETDAVCHIGNNLVWSSSFTPRLLAPAP